jgi:Flp pilus assembly protein TadD
LPDDVSRLVAWVAATTGLELDEQGSILVLDHTVWRERRRRLEELGGPPPADPAPRLDPIVFGPEPAARGDAWRERGQWDRAEAAYAEAARARPLNATVREALTRLHVERDHLDRAAATLAEWVRLKPDDLRVHSELGACLLYSGDRAGWRRATATMLDRFGGAGAAGTANDVAWACALGPGATADPGVPVRLAEVALRDGPESSRDTYLNTLGSALYRAGRYDEAIRRLQEGIEGRGGASLPDNWPFLAMAHHRLGHRAEARRWLDKLREYRPSKSPDRYWEELTTRLLRREAEAVVLYDPAFPDDPFSR